MWKEQPECREFHRMEGARREAGGGESKEGRSGQKVLAAIVQADGKLRRSHGMLGVRGK